MSLKQQRQGLRLSAKKAYDAIQGLKGVGTGASQDQLQKKGSLLKSYLERIEPLDSGILASITEGSEIEKELENIRSFNDSLLEAIADSQPVAPASPAPGFGTFNSAGIPQGTRVRLPQVEIPPFEGDPLQWQEFWDAFKAAIHSRAELDPVDKFTYLRGLLKGEPFHLVEGFRVTEANYEPVVSLLTQRYGDQQAVVFAHVEALLSLSPASGEVSSLVEMHTKLERHLRSLDSLQPERDAILYSVVLSKLPKFLKIEAHRKRGSAQDWSFKSLREWLQEEIRAREMGDRLHTMGLSDKREREGPPHKPFHPSKTTRPEGRKPMHSASFLVTQSKSTQCPFCSSAHGAVDCSRYPDTETRRAQLSNSCLSCLGKGHRAKDCRSRRPCRFCKKPGHHPSLCFYKFGWNAKTGTREFARTSAEHRHTPQKPEESHGDPVVSAATFSQHRTGERVSERTVMQTAVVQVWHGTTSKTASARILFDTGASRSFITTAKQRELNLPVMKKECLAVSTFQNSKRVSCEYKVVQFGIQTRDGSVQHVSAAVVPTITSPIQKVPIDARLIAVPEWTLSEPIVHQSEYVEVDILIGLDFYHSLVLPQRVQSGDNMWFLASKVGYIASGRVCIEDPGTETVAVMLQRTRAVPEAMMPPDVDLSRYWELENVGMLEKQDQPAHDEEALADFSSSIRFIEGRYQVKWPWKLSEKDLSDNRALSYGRLKSLIRQLSKSPERLESYHEVFKSQLDLGIIEAVSSGDPDAGLVYYMPHHAVYNPEKPTTKLRVVFDASSKSCARVASLNECLHRGPVLLEDLCGLILRFRTHAIALVSDIEKAFLQIELQADQRNVTRFLWVKSVNKPPVSDNIVTYRFCRVPFGVISSPFILSATVAHHLRQQQFEVARRLLRDIYVDNIITGEASLGEALDHYKQSKEIFSSASMNLREWHSNSPSVMQEIPPKDRGASNSPKVLGLKWDKREDCLRLGTVNATVGGGRVTKRSMLKVIAQVFDPCGFASPVLVRGKILIQDAWVRNLGWDEEVPNDLKELWNSFLFNSLQNIQDIRIPRYFRNADAARLQLHGFCDASQKACAAVVYLRIECTGAPPVSSLVIAKTRLAPIKQSTTIPRMELIAAVLAVRLLKFAKTQLCLPIVSQFLWTDSQCVLHWIKRDQVATRFVQNRVKELRTFGGVKFRYVPTSENPADLPTRGCEVRSLIDSALWWEGPAWLSDGDDTWPTTPTVDIDIASQAELLVLNSASDHQSTVENSSQVIVEEDYSSLHRLLRVTALVFRFVSNCRSQPDDRLHGNLLLKEINEAQVWWLRRVQTDLLCRVDGRITQFKAAYHSLNLFSDDGGLWRCRGRIGNSELPYSARFPALLPRKRHFTDLVIMAYHQRALHAGVAQTLGRIRQHFWIPRGREVVKRVIKSCRTCIRHTGGPFAMPEAPPLPRIRVEQAPPFCYTGLDYLGPVLLLEGGASPKVWICLLTCAVTRAIHLEVVTSLSTEQFLLALRRFVSVYGVPKKIVSDNGQQFRAAYKLIRRFEQEMTNSSDFQQFASDRGMTWHFIPERAPWMGGFYERLVGVVKLALRKSLHVRRVTLIELQTVVAEVASIVNSRPLTYIEASPDSVPLTPMQLISPMRRDPSPLMPPSDTDPEEQGQVPRQATVTDLLQRWRKAKTIVKEFWQSWRLHYLLSLRERAHLTRQRGVSRWIPRVGTLVHLKDNGPKLLWKLGKIHSLCESGDGQVRSAEVRMPNGRVLRRPLNLLFPLEVQSDLDAACPSQSPADPLLGRVPRPAALRAREAWQHEDDESD